LTDRAEERDPLLLNRIRQLVKIGLNLPEIFLVLRKEGRLRTLATLKKIVKRCDLVVVQSSPIQDRDECAHQQRIALAKARAGLAREIAEAKAYPAEPFKKGLLGW